ncbi:hypothetical protein H0H93_006236 [Arthromyces matolae]|nr:hypothetical protein H0H93_006236 [Arthromyces matolae]
MNRKKATTWQNALYWVELLMIAGLFPALWELYRIIKRSACTRKKTQVLSSPSPSPSAILSYHDLEPATLDPAQIPLPASPVLSPLETWEIPLDSLFHALDPAEIPLPQSPSPEFPVLTDLVLLAAGIPLPPSRSPSPAFVGIPINPADVPLPPSPSPTPLLVFESLVLPEINPAEVPLPPSRSPTPLPVFQSLVLPAINPAEIPLPPSRSPTPLPVSQSLVLPEINPAEVPLPPSRSSTPLSACASPAFTTVDPARVALPPSPSPSPIPILAPQPVRNFGSPLLDRNWTPAPVEICEDNSFATDFALKAPTPTLEPEHEKVFVSGLQSSIWASSPQPAASTSTLETIKPNTAVSPKPLREIANNTNAPSVSLPSPSLPITKKCRSRGPKFWQDFKQALPVELAPEPETSLSSTSASTPAPSVPAPGAQPEEPQETYQPENVPSVRKKPCRTKGPKFYKEFKKALPIDLAPEPEAVIPVVETVDPAGPSSPSSTCAPAAISAHSKATKTFSLPSPVEPAPGMASTKVSSSMEKPTIHETDKASLGAPVSTHSRNVTTRTMASSSEGSSASSSSTQPQPNPTASTPSLTTVLDESETRGKTLSASIWANTPSRSLANSSKTVPPTPPTANKLNSGRSMVSSSGGSSASSSSTQTQSNPTVSTPSLTTVLDKSEKRGKTISASIWANTPSRPLPSSSKNVPPTPPTANKLDSGRVFSSSEGSSASSSSTQPQSNPTVSTPSLTTVLDESEKRGKTISASIWANTPSRPLASSSKPVPTSLPTPPPTANKLDSDAASILATPSSSTKRAGSSASMWANSSTPSNLNTPPRTVKDRGSAASMWANTDGEDDTLILRRNFPSATPNRSTGASMWANSPDTSSRSGGSSSSRNVGGSGRASGSRVRGRGRA